MSNTTITLTPSQLKELQRAMSERVIDEDLATQVQKEIMDLLSPPKTHPSGRPRSEIVRRVSGS